MTTLSTPWGHVFRDPGLLNQALTHKSFHNENPTSSLGHNERLEFLGDAVLGLALSDLLMKRFPELSEGDLSKLRASLVNEAILAEISLEQKFDQNLKLGRGELQTGGAQKPRLLASVLEAFVGAIYLDSGFQSAFDFVVQTFSGRLESLAGQDAYARDYKTRLQELAQEQHRQAPVYSVVSEVGPDHDKTFEVAVQVAGKEIARGKGRSKKQAEQDAARAALEAWS